MASLLLINRLLSSQQDECAPKGSWKETAARPGGLGAQAVLSHLVGWPQQSGKLTFLANCPGCPAAPPGPPPPSAVDSQLQVGNKLNTAGRPSCIAGETAPTFHLSKWLRQQTLPCLHPNEFPTCGSFKNAEPGFCEHTLTGSDDGTQEYGARGPSRLKFQSKHIPSLLGKVFLMETGPLGKLRKFRRTFF